MSPHFASALTFQVEPRAEQCFFEEMLAGASFNMEFEVVRGGLLDIRLRILDPAANNVIEKMAFFNRHVDHTHHHTHTHPARDSGTLTTPSSPAPPPCSPSPVCASMRLQDDALNEAEGRVTLTAAMTGRYSICFDNSMSRWTAKVVSMFIPHGSSSSSSLSSNSAAASAASSATKLQDLGPMVDSIIKIADALDAIEQQQHHTRVKQQAWRDEGEAADDWVQWLSLLESVLLIGVTAAELQYIRAWFKDTGKTGRV